MRAASNDFRQLVAARDLDAAAVHQPRGLRAERAVHERLQVADAQKRIAEPRTDVDRLQVADALVRQRLPDAQRQPLRREPLPEAKRSEPTVLVVDGDDAARVRESHPRAHRVDVLVVGHVDVAIAERPAGLLA